MDEHEQSPGLIAAESRQPLFAGVQLPHHIIGVVGLPAPSLFDRREESDFFRLSFARNRRALSGALKSKQATLRKGTKVPSFLRPYQRY
jgi:hypothetical protein